MNDPFEALAMSLSKTKTSRRELLYIFLAIFAILAIIGVIVAGAVIGVMVIQ